jgi:hypothetical protein
VSRTRTISGPAPNIAVIIAPPARASTGSISASGFPLLLGHLREEVHGCVIECHGIPS